MPTNPPKEPSSARVAFLEAKRRVKTELQKAAREKAAGRARKRLHPDLQHHLEVSRALHGSRSHTPDQPLSEMLAASGPPGPSQPPSTYTPPGSSTGWLHGVGQSVTPGPAMADSALAIAQSAAKAKAKTGQAWNYCFHTHTTIPKVR